jgi:hypothetical protein
MAVKRFIVQAQGINGVKPFAAVNKFLQYAGEFVPGRPLKLGQMLKSKARAYLN